MKTLALRIYLTVVAVLFVFALTSGWLAQRNLEHERHQMQSQMTGNERTAALAELLEGRLPPASAPVAEQANEFLDWAERLRLPIALDSAEGERIATSPVLAQNLARRPELQTSLQSATLSDGRVLWFSRTLGQRGGRARGPDGGPGGARPPEPWLGPLGGLVPHGMAQGIPALLLSLIILFVAVAVGAWPVVNRLTRRLKALRQGVEDFGSGQLQKRVAVEGRDEVAALAQSFNEAAQRIEDLVTANRHLLANASHELRSPLARLKMATSLMGDASPEQTARMKAEIDRDIQELDALVEEVLLASRLDTRPQLNLAPVDLIGLCTEEANRVGASVDISSAFPSEPYEGDERLLRRAVRNLLENARRYGGSEVVLSLAAHPGGLELAVADRGPGVPPSERTRIFEPFYRMPGHAEHAGGVGLGLSLVKQIAESHGGTVACESREGGGSVFALRLPRQG